MLCGSLGYGGSRVGSAVLFMIGVMAVVASSDAAEGRILRRESLPVDTEIMSSYGALWTQLLSFRSTPDV